MKRDAQWDEPPGEILSPPTFKSISDIVLGSLRFEIPLLVRGCTHSCCPVIRFYWGGYLVWIAIWQYNSNATLKWYQSTLHKYQSCIILLWTPTRKKSYPFFWNAFLNVVCILKYTAHHLWQKIFRKYMSHFAYACKMRCPLNLVLENSEYLWFYWTFCIVILDYGLKLHKLSNHTLAILQKWLEIH